ncbi:MAG: hypothetical protein CMO55_04140 [Verrucomicrobiales bacterium]|nr:hypothetical protein [Verrucomicrobiales bacterium]
MIRGYLILPILGLLLAANGGVFAAAQDSQEEFFEKKIRPVLAEKCFKCHSAEAEKLKGSLQLDHLQHLLEGGDTGPAIVPGKVDESLLIESILYGNEDLQMPPKEKLSDEIVNDFKTWIASGAYWPEEKVPARGEKDESGKFDLQKRFQEHWSWRPVEKPELPSIEKTDWPGNPIDHFILSQIEKAGLAPADEAEKETWLRRVNFDLIGLPPTPDEIEQFRKDKSTDAHAKVVDRLLASPHFGEKWARHWMDLVRYADTYGHEFDYPIPHAHEYRDYLIRAYNQDVPYDLFIKEHIAGDLLDTPRRNSEKHFAESPIGTGFWFFHEATHAPTDVLANEADIMDNQIDVFGKSFLGLTVSCARCHDHKFDAISTADYYAMTAYLQSSARQEVLLDENGIRAKAKSNQEKIKKEADQNLTGLLPAASSPIESETALYEDFRSGEIPAGWSTTGLAFTGTGEKAGIRFDKDDPISVPGTIDSGVYGRKRIGTLRSPTFEITGDRIHILLKANKGTVKLVIDNYQMNSFHQLLFRGSYMKQIETEGGFKWITMTGNLDKYIGHKAYLEFRDDSDGSMTIDQIRFSNGGNAPPLPAERNETPSLQLSEETLTSITEGEKLTQNWPPLRRALAMGKGTPENAHVYIRGSHRSLGDEVPRRFLEALGGEEGDRLNLANQVASSANPLTARVMVNRIWHHLFGRGIVPTVDDFGPMGQPASHPELLDWLASDFVENGWSVKQQIRQIVLSSTYRQSAKSNSSVDPAKLATVDPDNVLLSSMPVRRLTAEAIRDSILSVSGRFDDEMFGNPVPTHRTAFMTGRGARDSGPLDGAGRRSIYGAVYRNFLSPFMLTFDTPSPFGPKGRRNISNVPAQALVLLNDPFVAEQSSLWGKHAVESKEPVPDRIRNMYLSGLGREPSQSELASVETFLTSRGVETEKAWADFAHVLFNTKEFIFLN